MFPKMDAKQMQKLMTQMGLKTLEIEAERVVIEKSGGGKLVVERPNVTVVEMQGQKTLQVTGNFVETEGDGQDGNTGTDDARGEDNFDDASIVAKEAGVSREQAEKALAECGGDLAQAILKLKGGN